MRTYIKFFLIIFYRAFLYATLVTFSLVYIVSLLSELDFFKEIDVEILTPLLLSFLISPSIIFEMFPFIFLITGQLFFIKLFENNQIETFKYSGLKNSKILIILSFISLFTGLFIITAFYGFSANLKNFYLELKSPYTKDGKYLAVITKNGLWIRDKVDNRILIINSSKIENENLINSFISEFDINYNSIRKIKSNKINIKNKEWLINDAEIIVNNEKQFKKLLKFKTNFDLNRIKGLYSDLSSLNIFALLELRENYKSLNYSIKDIDLQLIKIIVYPLYMLLMTIFAALTMFKIKKFSSTTFKISIGLFFSVIIYYINNFFFIMGATEKISVISSLSIPLLIMLFSISLMLNKINEK